MPRDDVPKCDLTLFEYPSDRITLGAMRRHEPQTFEQDSIYRDSLSCVRAVATLYWERVLAEKAFAKSLSMPDPHPNDGRSDIARMLCESYEAYGLTSGWRSALELVRSLEAQAVQQASRYRGTKR